MRFACEILGSARVPRVGFGVSPKQSFPDNLIPRKVRESETLSPTRGTRALPRISGVDGR